MPQRLIAIDPGTEYCGICKTEYDEDCEILSIEALTIRSDKVILPEAKIRAHVHGERYCRLMKLSHAFREIVLEYQPNVIVCEMPFYHNLHPGAFAPLVECVFTLRNVSMDINPEIPFIGYAPMVIKKIFAGRTNAKKPDMKEALLSKPSLIKLLPTHPDQLSEHAIDSIAVAISHLTTARKGP